MTPVVRVNTQTIYRTPKLNNNRTNHSIKKWAKGLNRYFSKDDKHMKRRSISLVINRMQVKNIMRYHCTPIRTAKIRKADYIKMQRNWNPHNFWQETKMLQPLWRTVRQFLKMINIHFSYESATPFWGITQEK